ncbi:methyltransferase domain-containing protein [Thermobifida halotolerans]|uniref:Methyltransferase domain-containing protein n=1 Tax=Thermobifida halotolerans TaxID=483545 RepID=A0A399G8F3_9ACTN|nr:methyltransferase domain-containing protein [Thermobifida halotolerans]UOE20212.1 methyltransferase domain-containing protein [Thermobifida halotolerans]
MDSSTVGSRRAASAARTAVVWEALTAELARAAEEFDGPLEIVDAGGGTGGAAVPLAGLGHHVTVVDPNPDSLAALERRAAEAGVRVRAVQGDTRDLRDLLPESHAHLVLVHNVLEYVDDPLVALRDVVSATRPGGVVSVMAANAVAAVLHRSLAGHLADALALLESPEGRWGPNDPMPRRFTVARLTALAREAGLARTELRGVRVLGDLLPGRVFEDPQTPDVLVALEKAASAHTELSGVATQLHLLARRPS